MSGRTRLAWHELPQPIRDRVSTRTGRVVGVVSHEGGYSPGLAATLTGDDGVRTFVKAVSTSYHERSAELYRDEARVNTLLPPGTPAPAMRWTFEHEDWVVLGFDAADAQVELPWDEPTLQAVLDLASELARVRAPEALPSQPERLRGLDGWHRAAEDGRDLSSWGPQVVERLPALVALTADYPERTAGTSLVHHDARRDNMVRLDGRLLLVDWPYACAGAPWVDLLAQLPSVVIEGGGDAAAIWARADVARHADPDDVTAVLAGLAGYFVCASVLPAPVGVPHVRAFQRAQGEAALTWLWERLG